MPSNQAMAKAAKEKTELPVVPQNDSAQGSWHTATAGMYTKEGLAELRSSQAFTPKPSGGRSRERMTRGGNSNGGEDTAAANERVFAGDEAEMIHEAGQQGDLKEVRYRTLAAIQGNRMFLCCVWFGAEGQLVLVVNGCGRVNVQLKRLRTCCVASSPCSCSPRLLLPKSGRTSLRRTLRCCRCYGCRCLHFLVLLLSLQDLNKNDISRLKGRHEAMLASREAMGKGAPGSGDGEDFIPLDAKVWQTISTSQCCSCTLINTSGAFSCSVVVFTGAVTRTTDISINLCCAYVTNLR